MTTLVVLQPSYLPWLGYFEQMYRSDVFVCYDDVAYDKHGWRNRNRIKGQKGPLWLTVPVLTKGRQGQNVADVELDDRTDWARKQLATIKQSYARADHLGRYYPELEELLTQPWQKLVDLDMATIALMCSWLGLDRPVHKSSELGVGGGRSDRLLRLCKHFGADTYLSGDAARTYLDLDLFERARVAVQWQDYRHPEYRQLHGNFEPRLSALDLIFNAGPASLGILTNGAVSDA